MVADQGLAQFVVLVHVAEPEEFVFHGLVRGLRALVQRGGSARRYFHEEAVKLGVIEAQALEPFGRGLQVETEILARFQQDFGFHEGRIIEVKAAG